MDILELKARHDLSADIKLSRIYLQFGNILEALKARNLPGGIIPSVNKSIEEVNTTSLNGAALRKLVKQKQTEIMKLLEKELRIVPKNHYRNIWLPVGMSVFGLPIGIAFGLSIGNMGLLATGLPLGMLIGIVAGSAMDAKALREGRQLDLEIKY